MGGALTGGMGGAGGAGAGVSGAGELVGSPPPPGPSTTYYYGDFDTDEVFQVARIEQSGDIKTTLTLNGLSGADITSLALSANGKKLAVAGVDVAGQAPVVNVYDLPLPGTPRVAFDATNTTVSASAVIKSLAWSDDGGQLAFRADSSWLARTRGSPPRSGARDRCASAGGRPVGLDGSET